MHIRNIKIRLFVVVCICIAAIIFQTQKNLTKNRNVPFANRENQAKEVRDYSEIKESGVLRVGMEYGESGYYPAGDSFDETQYKLCEYISQKAGLELVIVSENNIERNINNLLQKKIDIIASNLSITTDRRKYLDFTIPINQSKYVLIQRKKEQVNDSVFISSQIELAHKTVFLMRNSLAKLRIENLSEEIAEPIYINEIEESNPKQILHEISLGNIDYAVLDKEVASRYQLMFPEIDTHIDISFAQLQAWAVRKDSPILLDSLNVWLSEKL